MPKRHLHAAQVLLLVAGCLFVTAWLVPSSPWWDMRWRPAILLISGLWIGVNLWREGRIRAEQQAWETNEPWALQPEELP